MNPSELRRPDLPYPESDMASHARKAESLYGDHRHFEGLPRTQMGVNVSRRLHDWIALPAMRAGLANPYAIPLRDETDLFHNLKELVASGHFVHAPFVLHPTDYASLPPEELHHWDPERMELFTLSTFKRKDLNDPQKEVLARFGSLVDRIQPIPIFARGAAYALNLMDSYMRRAIDARIKAEQLVSESKPGIVPAIAKFQEGRLDELIAHEHHYDQNIRTLDMPFIRLMHAATNYEDLRNAYHAAWPEKRYLALAAIHYHAPFLVQSGLEEQAGLLQDLALQHLHPNESTEIKRVLDSLAPQFEQKEQHWTEALREALDKRGIVADITFRRKGIFSVWEKLLRKPKYSEPLQLGDLFGAKIVIKGIKETKVSGRGKRRREVEVVREPGEPDCYRVHSEILPQVLVALKKSGHESVDADFDLVQDEDYIKKAKREEPTAEEERFGIRPPAAYRALHRVVKFADVGPVSDAPLREPTPTPFRRHMPTFSRAIDFLFSRSAEKPPEPLNPQAHVPGLEDVRLRQMEIQVLTDQMDRENKSGPLSRYTYKRMEAEPAARPLDQLFHGTTYDPNETRVSIELPGQEPTLHDVPQDSTFLNILMHSDVARDLALRRHLKITAVAPDGKEVPFSLKDRISLPEHLREKSTLKPWYQVKVQVQKKSPTRNDLLIWKSWVDSRFHGVIEDAIKNMPG